MNARRPLILGLLVPVLALSACGGRGDDDPVEGNTTPTTSKAGGQRTIKDQTASLLKCTGNKKGGMLKVFAPTVVFARNQGGDAVSVKVGKSGVELIAFPSAGTTQQGYRDAQDRLINLQQTDPKGFAKLSGTALEIQQNVVIISPHGALAAADSQTLTGCVASSVKG